MATFSKEPIPYNLLRTQYLKPGQGIYSYHDSLAFWIRSTGILSNKYERCQNVELQMEWYDDMPPSRFEIPSLKVDFPAGTSNVFKIGGTGFQAQSLTPKDGLLVSFWLKLNSASHPDASSHGSNILHVHGGTSANKILDVFSLGSGANFGQIGIRFYDNSNPTTKFVDILSSNSAPLGDWAHYAFYFSSTSESSGAINTGTLAASGGILPYKLFINGASVPMESATFSADASGAITITNAQNNSTLYFGNGGGIGLYPSTSQVRPAYMAGYLTELAFYDTPATLTDDQIIHLYKASILGAYNAQSGFINNPVRIIRNSREERSYWPSTVKGGDPRRLGNPAIKWDDLKRPEYTDQEINYPTMLHINDSLLSSSIYNYYIDGQLNLTNTSETSDGPKSQTFPVSTYNMFYEREDEVPYSPFEDSRVYLEYNTDFVMSGSNIPEFTGSLTGKDVVVMEFVVSEKAEFARELDRTDYGHTQHHMGYYNLSEKKITMQRGTTTPLEANPSHGNYSNFIAHKNNVATAVYGDWIRQLHQESCYGFAPLPKVLLKTGSNGWKPFHTEYYASAGSPIDIAGFPSDSRYEPISGSQSIFKASDYIHSPFLVEKIVYQLPKVEAHTGDADSHSVWFSTDASEPSRRQAFDEKSNQLHMFLMRQYKNPNNISKELAEYSTGSIAAVYATRGRYPAKFAANANDLHSHIECSGTTDRDLLFYSPILFHYDVNAAIVQAWSATYPENIAAIESIFGGLFAATSSIRQNYDHVVDIGSGFDYDIFGENRDAGDRWLVLTASTVIEAIPRNIAKSNYLMPYHTNEYVNNAGTIVNSSYSTFPLTWRGGSRSYKNEFFARSIGNHVSTDTGKVDYQFPNFYSLEDENEVLNLQSEKVVREDSPFLLFPEDDLILGFQGGISGLVGNGSGASSPDLDNNSLIIESGSIKIQLFGSYIQDNKPKLPMLNQSNGYSEAVHGAIGEITVHDQWDIPYRQEFSGSNPDTFFGPAEQDGVVINHKLPTTSSYTPWYAASAATLKSHHGINSLNLARSGLASNGTIGMYGSLDRTFKLSEIDIYDKDSITLDLEEIWARDGVGYFSQAGTNNKIAAIGNPSPAQYNAHWTYAFPFEDRYSGVSRQFKNLDTSVGDTLVLLFTIQDGVGDPAATGSFMIGCEADNGIYVSSSRESEPASILRNQPISEYQEMLRSEIFFGIGGGHGGRHILNVTAQDHWKFLGIPMINTYASIEKSRGCKYGLSNWWPIPHSAIFRRNSFGQFRDMLEPRIFGPTMDPTLTEIEEAVISRTLISNGAITNLTADQAEITNKDENYKVKKPFFDIAKQVYTQPESTNSTNITTTTLQS